MYFVCFTIDCNNSLFALRLCEQTWGSSWGSPTDTGWCCHLSPRSACSLSRCPCSRWPSAKNGEEHKVIPSKKPRATTPNTCLAPMVLPWGSPQWSGGVCGEQAPAGSWAPPGAFAPLVDRWPTPPALQSTVTESCDLTNTKTQESTCWPFIYSVHLQFYINHFWDVYSLFNLLLE